jgi:hypothetical protein
MQVHGSVSNAYSGESTLAAIQKVLSKLQWKSMYDIVSGSEARTSQVSESRIFFLCKFTWVWSLSLEASHAKKQTLGGALLFQMKADKGVGAPWIFSIL